MHNYTDNRAGVISHDLKLLLNFLRTFLNWFPEIFKNISCISNINFFNTLVSLKLNTSQICDPLQEKGPSRAKIRNCVITTCA